MSDEVFADGSDAAAHAGNNIVAASMTHCSCATDIKVAVRKAVKNYGEHYIDVAAEDIANEVKYRPAVG